MLHPLKCLREFLLVLVIHQCGNVKGQLGQTIIPNFNGTETQLPTLGQLPHAVVLLVDKGKCTGAIIHASWVLTAGHCVAGNNGKPLPLDNVKILAGVLDFTRPGPQSQTRTAKQIIPYPDYVFDSLGKFDIALIKVDPFTLNSYVNVASLSGKEWPQDRRMLNRSCVSAGWGMLAGRRSTSILHMQSIIARHGDKSCPCVHKGYIEKRVVCLTPESKIGICFGDSGGALMCDGEIVGVAHVVMDKRSCSYFKEPDPQIQCESSYVFGIYMYTCPYLEWIRKHVPGVPTPPASCRAPITNPSTQLLIGITVLGLLFNWIKPNET